MRAINPSVPIIGITGMSDQEMMTKAEALGISAMLLKPFTMSQLFTAVQAVLPAVGPEEQTAAESVGGAHGG